MKKDGAKRIVATLDQRIRSRKRGIVAAINRVVKKGNAWWHHRRAAGNITLTQMMAILDYLGLDPVRFIRDAVGRKDGLELDRPNGDPPEIVVRAWERFEEDTPFQGTVGEDTLKTLDRMRYQEPQRVLDHAAGLIEFCPRELLPKFLGVSGSAWRLLVNLDKAEHSIQSGIRMAQLLGDEKAVGELLQRLCYVFIERSQWKRALVVSEQATMRFIRCEERVSVGKSLVDQGILLRLLGRFREAIAVQKMALELLPPEETHNRTASLVNVGINLRGLRRPKEALVFASRAEQEAIDLPQVEQDRVKWLRGNLCADFGSLDEASRLLAEVVESLAKVHLGEMALAACDLARIQLLRKETNAAFRTVGALTLLLEPMRKNQVISEAVADLLRNGEKGLTPALVQGVRSRIEGELVHRPIWRRLWVKSSYP